MEVSDLWKSLSHSLFSNMDDDFDGWQGIFGQYARGWTDMPDGAIWLTDVGTPDTFGDTWLPSTDGNRRLARSLTKRSGRNIAIVVRHRRNPRGCRTR